MSKRLRQFVVGMTVRDSSDLPDGMDDDVVVNEVRDVVEKAVAEWYVARGHEFLACEPLVG